MSQLTISDIHKRIKGLKEDKTNYTNPGLLENGARSIINTGNAKEAKAFIENATTSGKLMSLSTYLDLYEVIVENGTLSEIETAGNYILNEVVHKVRDAKATNTLLKRRLGRAKGKIAKNKALENMANATKSNLSFKQEAVVSLYEKMIDKNIIYNECDRVIENYNSISKRFNLEILFIENTRVNGVYDTVLQLCNLIDTYSMPNDIKFNTIIETAWYGLESNNIEYNKSEILSTAVDYFAFKENGINDCKNILDTTLFFDKDEYHKDIEILMEDEPEEDETVEEKIDEYCVSKVTESSEENNNEEDDSKNVDFNKIFVDFKKNELTNDKNPSGKIKGLIKKLYSKNVNSIAKDTPDFLKWIRGFFILGSISFPLAGPVIAAVAFIADRFISLNVDRKETETMIKALENEKQIAETKLDTVKDKETREKLDKYISSLDDAISKVTDYHENLFTDKELDEKRKEKYSDYELEEGARVIAENISYGSYMMDKIYSNMESFVALYENDKICNEDMYTIVSLSENDTILDIASFAAKYNDEFNKDRLVRVLENKVNDIRHNDIVFESTLNRILTLDALKNSIDICNMQYTDTVDRNITMEAANTELESVIEAYSAMNILKNHNPEENYLTEGSITNSLKMASMKLRSAFDKMSDKEKNVSKSIDYNMKQLAQKAEDAIVGDNREQVIKGSILPSASKIIKMAIVHAGIGLIFMNPVISVITFLGQLAIMNHFKRKERQLVIDEIEIELKMCKKYIEIAESKNDLKALKQLLTIQRDLERQYQRIKYKMKLDLKQKVYDTRSADGIVD